MQIPGLGQVKKDDRFEWHRSEPIAVPVLGMSRRIAVEGYSDDANQEEFHTAIANFLSIGRAVLTDAEEDVFRYYRDCKEWGDDDFVSIDTPSEVWRHVQFGEPVVLRRPYHDKGVYISLECNCDWEQEHGLQIVFKNGLRVSKLGPYNGHLSNADAFADGRLEDVVYRSMNR